MEQPLKRWVVTGGVAFWWGVAQGRGLKEAWPERWYGGVASMGMGRDLERGLGRDLEVRAGSLRSQWESSEWVSL